jgi:biotin carboxyl carrier protein
MEIKAEWPGTVAEVKVAPGDAVNEEDELLIIESMKMLTPVVAPSTGKVEAIHVAVGDFVDEGALLLTLA